jgi:hypothetical protein
VIHGTVDIGSGSTTDTLAREKVIDFSLSNSFIGSRTIVPKASPFMAARICTVVALPYGALPHSRGVLFQETSLAYVKGEKAVLFHYALTMKVPF